MKPCYSFVPCSPIWKGQCSRSSSNSCLRSTGLKTNIPPGSTTRSASICSLQPQPSDCIPEDETKNSVPYSTFLQQYDISMDGVEIRDVMSHNNGNGEVERGLFATRDVVAGEAIIKFSKENCVYVDMANPSGFDMIHFKHKHQEKSVRNNPFWYVRLASMLIDEKLKGEQSRFFRYIEMLPKEPKSAIWAGINEESKELTAAQLKKYGMWNVSELFIRNVNKAFKVIEVHEQNSEITHELFLWALSICISRAFALPTHGNSKDLQDPLEYALIPGLDMANHCVLSNSRLKFDSKTDLYSLYSGMKTEQGREIYVSYGMKHNDELAYFYGFVEGNNPGNKILLHDLPTRLFEDDTIEDRKQKAELLEALELTGDKLQLGVRGDGVEDDLMKILRVMYMTKGEFEEFQAEYEGKEDRDAAKKNKLKKHVSLENEVRVWDVLMEWCSEIMDDSFNQFGDRGDVFSKTWEWGVESSQGELLYGWERNRIAKQIIERLSHFKKMSMAIGTVCTVLLPPTQSMLRTEVYDHEDSHDDEASSPGAGLRMFDVIHEDIQKSIENFS